MLILTRKPGESLYIGDDVKVTIVELKGHQVRVGIHAPPEMRIYREEIYLQILEENKAAAEAAQAADVGLEGLGAVWSETKPPSGDSDEGERRTPEAVIPGSFHKAVLNKPVFSPKMQGGSQALKGSVRAPEVVVKRKPTKKPEND